MSITFEFYQHFKNELPEFIKITETNIRERLITVRCQGIPGSDQPLLKVDFDILIRISRTTNTNKKFSATATDTNRDTPFFSTKAAENDIFSLAYSMAEELTKELTKRNELWIRILLERKILKSALTLVSELDFCIEEPDEDEPYSTYHIAHTNVSIIKGFTINIFLNKAEIMLYDEEADPYSKFTHMTIPLNTPDIEIKIKNTIWAVVLRHLLLRQIGSTIDHEKLMIFADMVSTQNLNNETLTYWLKNAT